MSKYKYHNYKTGEVVEIETDDILSADKIFMDATTLNPAKCMFIGCEVELGRAIKDEQKRGST